MALLGPFFAAVAVAMRPLSGTLADRGLTRSLLVAGSILSLACQILYAAASNMGNIYVGRAVQGAAVALFMPASFQAAAQGDMRRIVRSLAWRNTVVGFSFATGPALGGYIVDSLGYRSLFAFSAIMAAASAAFSLIFTGRSVASLRRGKRIPLRSIATPSFLAATAALLIYSSAYMSFYIFLPAMHKEKGLGASLTAAFFASFATSSLVSRIMYTRVVDLLNVKRTALLGILTASTGLVMAALNPLEHIIVYFGIVAGLGAGLAVPSMQIFSISEVPPERRGSASALYTAMFDLGSMVGPLGLSLVGGYGVIIEASSILMIFSAAPIALARDPAQQGFRIKRAV